MILRFIKYCLIILAFGAINISPQGITISDGATFSLGSSTLSIPNNFVNNGTFNHNDGKIIVNGSTGDQTYKDTSSTQVNNLTINKNSGDLILESSINLKGTISLISGDLDLNGYNVYMNPSALLSESQDNTVKGTSGYIEVTENITAPSDTNLFGLGFQITSAQDFGSTILRRGNKVHTSNGNSSIARYFDITPTNNSALNTDLVFNYDDAELNGLTESQLLLFKSEDGGNSWKPQGGIIDTANNRITLNGIDKFSMWTLADSAASLTNHQVSAANTKQTKYFEQGAAVVLFDDISVSDEDGPSEQITATLTLSDINSGVLTAASGNGESYNASTGIWSITNTLPNVNTALASVSYIPALGVRYNKTVKIYIADELADSTVPVSGSISLRVLNQPTTTGIENIILEEDAPDFTIDLSQYFDDLKDGPTGLTYSVDNVSNSKLFFRYYIINSGLTFELNPGQSGSSEVKVRATDSDNLSVESTFNVSINSVNDAPVISSIKNIYSNEDISATVTVSVYDPDGDKITLTAVSSDENVSISINSKTLTLTPSLNWSGTAQITVEANDGIVSAFKSFPFIVAAVNDPPVFVNEPSISFSEDENYFYDLHNFNSLISDPDNDNYTYILNYSNSCMNVEAMEDHFCYTFTPPLNWFGADTISIGVSDGIDTTYSDLILNVISVNDRPEFISNPTITFNEDESYFYDFHNCDSLVSDPDNDSFTYLLNYAESCMDVSEMGDHYCFTFTPPQDWFGTDTILVGVCDGTDTSYTGLLLTVNPVNDEPVISDFPDAIVLLDDEQTQINVWESVHDIETPDNQLSYSFDCDHDSVNISFDESTGLLRLSATESFFGETTLTFSLSDPEGGSVQILCIISVERSATGINKLSGIPDDYIIYQNYPNPFNPATVIRYGLPEESSVHLVIYNILGQEITVLNNDIMKAGYYEISWNARNYSSGIYIYRISAKSLLGEKDFTKTSKMILIK